MLGDTNKRELAEFVLMESPVEGVAGFGENILKNQQRLVGARVDALRWRTR